VYLCVGLGRLSLDARQWELKWKNDQNNDSNKGKAGGFITLEGCAGCRMEPSEVRDEARRTVDAGMGDPAEADDFLESDLRMGK